MTLHCCWLHDTIVLITCVHCTVIIKRIDFYSTDLKQIIQETTCQDILNLDFSCTVKHITKYASLETENLSLAPQKKKERERKDAIHVIPVRIGSRKKKNLRTAVHT